MILPPRFLVVRALGVATLAAALIVLVLTTMAALVVTMVSLLLAMAAMLIGDMWNWLTEVIRVR